ncbi:MAG: hypothetical protein AAF401_14705 [Pseudomonadota bacterium]
MPAPVAIAPIAWKAAQLGAVAALTWYAARRRRPDGPRNVWRERVLDDVGEGLETDASHGDGQARVGAAARWRRIVRVGTDGPGVEVDFASLTRMKLRRVHRGE